MAAAAACSAVVTRAAAEQRTAERRHPAAAEHAAEQLVQIDILEALLPGTALAERIPARTTSRTAGAAAAETAELLTPVRVDLAPVEFRPLVLVPQQVESGRDPLEPLVSDRIAGVLVRMEFLGELNGASWYDDSKGTNIGSVVKSLAGMEKPVVLIAGDKDKQGDLSALEPIIRDKVDHLVLIGAAAGRMAQAFDGLTKIHRASDMHEAVGIAAQVSRPGGSVLLSPGCSSFDMFKSFAERGRIFAREFHALSCAGEASNGN